MARPSAIDSIPPALFVYKANGLDTAEIRGKQISQRMGCDSIKLADFNPDVASRYAVVIYVKSIPSGEVMRRVRDRGVRQVMDVLDNYWGWHLPATPKKLLKAVGLPRLEQRWSTLGNKRDHPDKSVQHLDAFIAANLTQRVYLERQFTLPAVEIPHHHCNFASLRIPNRKRRPVVGYISTPAELKTNKAIAEKAGCSFLSRPQRRTGSGLEALVKQYMETDIGVAYRWDWNKLRFNCANKLTNFMSFGIPAVMTPESGYLEYARHGETAFFAYDKEDFVNFIRCLASDARLRREMGDACYEAAKPFHIDSIAKRYRAFLSALADNDTFRNKSPAA
jgi:hypothetical protein